ncbi:MAG: MBOAT family protein, partial [Neisseria sp.]|nr:MBOAT family protein [Neisseria sp.]
MPLLSIEFAVFFIVFLPLYWAFARLPQVQNVLLLVAGLGWLYRIDPIFAALILVYSSVVYLVSVLMFSENENIRKFWLGCGISAALTVLCFFKYFDFFRPIIQQYTG